MTDLRLEIARAIGSSMRLPNHMDRADEVLKAIEGAGFVVVPREATDAMVEAHVDACAGDVDEATPNRIRECWEEMLRAAPAIADMAGVAVKYLPRAPTTEMLAAAAPIATGAPSEAAMRLAGSVVMHFGVATRKDALIGIAQIVDDYQAMWDAAPPLAKET